MPIRSTTTLEHDGIEWWIEQVGEGFWQFEAIAFPPEDADGNRGLPERIEGAVDSKTRADAVIEWFLEFVREGPE